MEYVHAKVSVAMEISTLQQVYLAVPLDEAMPGYLEASVAVDNTTEQCLKGPLRDIWPMDKASPEPHLQMNVSVDESMLQKRLWSISKPTPEQVDLKAPVDNSVIQ